MTSINLCKVSFLVVEIGATIIARAFMYANYDMCNIIVIHVYLFIFCYTTAQRPCIAASYIYSRNHTFLGLFCWQQIRNKKHTTIYHEFLTLVPLRSVDCVMGPKNSWSIACGCAFELLLSRTCYCDSVNMRPRSREAAERMASSVVTIEITIITLFTCIFWYQLYGLSPVSSTIIEIGATPVSMVVHVDTIANIFRAVRSFILKRWVNIVSCTIALYSIHARSLQARSCWEQRWAAERVTREPGGNIQVQTFFPKPSSFSVMTRDFSEWKQPGKQRCLRWYGDVTLHDFRVPRPVSAHPPLRPIWHLIDAVPRPRYFLLQPSPLQLLQLPLATFYLLNPSLVPFPRA